MAARREWRAAGRDVAQVREGAETSPRRVGVARTACGKNAGVARDREGGARKRQSTLRKKRGCAREGSGAVRSGVGGVWKKRGCSPRGEWGGGEWRGQLAEMNGSSPRGIPSAASRSRASGTIGADATHHIARRVNHEAIGKLRDGNGHIGQAEGAVATLANEVQVQIRRIVGRRFAAMAVVGAEGVLHLSRAVLDMVHQMVLGEGGEGAKHRAALHRAQPRFAVGERKGATCVEQRAQYQQPCGGGTNAAVQQFFFFVGGHGQVG